MNYFKKFTWKKILSEFPQESDFEIQKYYKILSPDFPDFLKEYLRFDSVQRLKKIGLLCGTDWTRLYKNRFFYSRFDHSVAVALIIWNFTHDKKQTLSGLFHDISTPIFSHVVDFKNGDALTQSFTESSTKKIILNDEKLCQKLAADKIQVEEICDYHIYPIADNEIPGLSADRLEYMFPSGAALHNIWTLSEIKKVYNDITILKNEQNKDELGFKTLEIAELYKKNFCKTSHILQLNENKLCLQLLAEILNLAIKEKIISEQDFFTLSEKEAISVFLNYKKSKEFSCLLKTFLNMKKIKHTSRPKKNHFCVNLKVKQRFINPLVKTKNGSCRISKISKKSAKIIKDFLAFSDTKYGCVKLEN